MKTNNCKQQYAKERLVHKNVICTSNAMVKWCKNYLSRSTRRKSKQNIYKEMKEHKYQFDVID